LPKTTLISGIENHHLFFFPNLFLSSVLAPTDGRPRRQARSRWPGVGADGVPGGEEKNSDINSWEIE